MNTYADKSTQQKNDSHANGFSDQAAGYSILKYKDNRSSSTIQAKMQLLANQSTQVKQLKTWQKFVNENHTSSVKQLQHIFGRNYPIQRTISLSDGDSVGAAAAAAHVMEVKDVYDLLIKKGKEGTERLWVEIAKLSARDSVFPNIEALIAALDTAGAFDEDYEDGFYADQAGEDKVDDDGHDEPNHAPVASSSGAGEQSDDGPEEVYYENGNGVMILEADYERIMELIDSYDVALESNDFSRGAAMGSAASEVNMIGVGLSELATFIKSNRMLARMFDMSVIHPAKGRDARSQKYGGRSFMQILGMAAQGNECHNDLAQALRECLSDFKKV